MSADGFPSSTAAVISGDLIPQGPCKSCQGLPSSYFRVPWKRSGGYGANGVGVLIQGLVRGLLAREKTVTWGVMAIPKYLFRFPLKVV